MKLSELNNISKEDVELGIFGIEVDQYTPEVHNEITTIGFIVKKDIDGEIDLDTMDVVLSYITYGKKVLLELPFEEKIDPSELMAIARSIGVDISILPPKEKDGTNIKEYTDLLIVYAKKWFGELGNKTQVHPVTGFFEYLVFRTYGETNTITRNPYFQKNFVDTLDDKEMDYIKNCLTDVIHGFFDGPDRFNKYIHTCGFNLLECSSSKR